MTRYPKGLAITRDGRTVAIGQSDGTVDLVDAQTLQRRGRLRALRGYAAAVAISPDGHLIAVTGEGGQVTLWDARTLRSAGELKGLRATSQALAFSPHGSLLAASEVNMKAGNVVVWNVRRRAVIGAYSAEGEIDALAFSPDGRLLAVTTERRVEIRDARGGRLVARLATPDRARSVAFSPIAPCSPQGTSTAPSCSGRPRAGSPWDACSKVTKAASNRWCSPPTAARCLPAQTARSCCATWPLRRRSARRRPWNPTRTSPPFSPPTAPASSLSPSNVARSAGTLLRGLEATRLPRRWARAHRPRVAGRTARAAVPLHLPRRLTPPPTRDDPPRSP